MNFKNQVVIITGSGRGLGAAYAEELSRRGAYVVVHDGGVALDGTGSDASIAQIQADKIIKQGGHAIASTTNINTRDGCQTLINETIQAFGKIDILIHNAGWVGYQTIETLTPEFLHRAIEIQLEAPVWLAQAAWRHMKQQKYGRIIFTTSNRAIYPEHAQPGLVSYAATKISQIGIMNVLAMEGAEDGILVNTVSPVAKTRMWRGDRETPGLNPSSIVPGVVYLASSECQDSGWIVRAANHQFYAIRGEEAEDVDYPLNIHGVFCKTAEAFTEQWPQITRRCGCSFAIPSDRDRERI